MADRWVTNLESREHLAAQVARAEDAVRQAGDGPERRQAKALLETARYKQRDVENTYRKIADETKQRFTFGQPRETPWRKAEEIAADGIIGIYMEGAGTGGLESVVLG